MSARWVARSIDHAAPGSHSEKKAGLDTAGSAGIMSLRTFLHRLLPARSEDIRPSHAFWHEINPPLYRSFKLIDGGRSRQTGRLWRRRTAAGAWEYRQDPETFDEFLDRQW